MRQFVKTLLCTAAVATVAMIGSAQAALLGSGSVSMAGGWEPSGGTGMASATGVHFLPAGSNNVTVTAPGGLGSFSTLSAGTTGTIKDFTFNPSSAPVANFLQIGGFNFSLQSTHVDLQNSSFLNITGATHVVHGDDSGDATFLFSAQGGGQPATFSWSATAATAAVPEPATLGVLGIGLAAFGLLRRRQQTV